MATINYKCDTCKRNIELLENKVGLTNQNLCVITKNCRGNLYSIKRNPNNVRESLPAYDQNLEDYVQRKLFYKHIQIIPNTEWIVNHSLGDSIVFIVYGNDNIPVDVKFYTTSKIEAGSSLIKFATKFSGIAHVLTRTGGAVIDTTPVSIFDVRLTNDGILTFAIPKYITRVDSRALPIVPPPLVAPTPMPSLTPLPMQSPTPIPPFDELFSPCNRLVKIEIEIRKPNEEPLTCTEVFDASISQLSAWSGWNEILVKNRKHYCIKTKKISDLKVFSNTNKQVFVIPEGTTLRILRIDYGTGVLTNIPDRGLLMLLTDDSGPLPVKRLDKIIDCGELVGTATGVFSFKNDDLFSIDDLVELSYPSIKKYS